MIFGVAEIVWWCSQYFIMEPGDIIVTGTPSGVALGMKPEPKFLNVGDVVELGIDGLGTQKQKIVKAARLIPMPASVIATKQKPRAVARGFRFCASVRTTRSVAGEDRAGELVVQAGANDVFLEADIVHERRRRRC